MLFSLAQAARDQELPPEGLHPAMSCSQASPWGFSCISRLSSRTRGAGPAQSVPQECPNSTPSCHCWGTITGCWGTPSSREEPHSSPLECVLLER